MLCGCSTSKLECYNYELAQEETLIKLWAKIITSGSIEFLSYENGIYKLSEYTYRLNKKNLTLYCSYRGSTLYNADDLIRIGRGENWMTSSDFRNHYPYFRCFPEDFLELSNEEKISVLNTISEKSVTR